MPYAFYFPYLLVLLLLPVLARWRWGLLATITVTIVEMALVILIFYLMDAYRLFPDVLVGEPPPQHPLEKIKRGQAAGFVTLIVWGAGPAAAALVGGGLAVVWSVVAAIWHLLDRRMPQ